MIDAIIADLKNLGTNRALASWERLGMNSRLHYLGTNLSQLKVYAKKLKKDHQLAMSLWRSGIYDCMLLACYIDEAKRISPSEADEVIGRCDVWGISDQYVKNQLVKASFVQEKAEEWIPSEKTFFKRSGFQLLNHLLKNSALPDAYFIPYIEQIRNVETEENWVREMMAYTLMSAKARPTLQKLALEIAEEVSPIQVDYGDTSCKLPDVRSYLQK